MILPPSHRVGFQVPDAPIFDPLLENLRRAFESSAILRGQSSYGTGAPSFLNRLMVEVSAAGREPLKSQVEPG